MSQGKIQPEGNEGGIEDVRGEGKERGGVASDD